MLIFRYPLNFINFTQIIYQFLLNLYLIFNIVQQSTLYINFTKENSMISQGRLEQYPHQHNNPNSVVKEQVSQNINGNSICQYLFFSWAYKLVNNSIKSINLEKIPALPEQYSVKTLFALFEQQWKKINKAQNENGWALAKTIVKILKKDWTISILMAIFLALSFLAIPILISLCVDYISNNGSLKEGIILFFMAILNKCIYSFLQAHIRYHSTCLELSISNVIKYSIFNKALKYSILTDKKFSEAEIINYCQTDAQNLNGLVMSITYCILVIIGLIGGFIMLFVFIGITTLIGIAILIVISIVAYFLGKKSLQIQNQILDSKDKRVQSTEEMLNIIKFVKINAIEKKMYKQINQNREEQLHHYSRKIITDSLLKFILSLVSPLLHCVLLPNYYYIQKDISTATVFSTIMIVTIFGWILFYFSSVISKIFSIAHSIKRIQTFLLANQINIGNYLKNTPVNENIDYSVKVESGNFYSHSENQLVQQDKKQSGHLKGQGPKINAQALQTNQFQNSVKILKDISLVIQKKKFVMILGDIGSGKSSLLLALLNQLNKGSGTDVKVNGSVAYVAQKPWVMSNTVRNNIILYSPFNQRLFEEACVFSAFKDDIKILPQNIETQIGQNGVNLSGGQKFRICLARSLYQNKDILLLDDVLSAVDIHVGTFLVEQCIKKYLADKSVILATHALRFSYLADYIVIMKRGQIITQGTFNQISKTAEYLDLSTKQQKKMAMEMENSPIKTYQQNKNGQNDSLINKQAKSNQVQSKCHQNEINQCQNQKIVENLMLPQDQQTGAVDLQVFKKFINLNGGFGILVLAIVCLLASVVLQAFSNIFISLWCQNSFELYYLYFSIGFMISSPFFIFIALYIFLYFGIKQSRVVHQTIIKKLLYADYINFFNRVPAGRILNRLGNDLRDLDEFVGSAFIFIVISFLKILAAIIICVYASVPYALIPFAACTVAFFFIRKYYIQSQRNFIRLVKMSNSPISSNFIQSLKGATTIRAFNEQKMFLDKQLQKLNDNQRISMSSHAMYAWFTLTLEYLDCIVYIFCVGFCMFSASINPSMLGLVLIYILQLNDAVIIFMMEESQLQFKYISLQRIYNFTNIQPEPAYKTYCDDWKQQQEGFTPAITQGSIEFRNLTVRYRKDLPNIIKGLSCTILAGEKVGIVGRTGSGKSTMINTLTRITEIVQGDILIDRTSIGKFELKSLRREITVIDQQPILINSSFRDNLNLFGQYSEQELILVLKQCNIWAVVERKGGLSANVSNNCLSAGEKQLICICRALLSRSKIVLIDEATANIDFKNDEVIQKIISERFKDRTIITIAHRLSTVEKYDKIMVLDAGRLIQFGTPAELLSAKGFYFHMIEQYNKEKNRL